MHTEHQALTVGQLRAELMLYPDDTPIEVYIPNGPNTWTVLPVVSAGYGSGVTPDPVLASSLPLQAADDL